MTENSTNKRRANERVDSGLHQVFSDLAGGDSNSVSTLDPTEEFDAPDAATLEEGRDK